MSTRAELLLTGKDQTGPAFASLTRRFDGITKQGDKVKASIGNALGGALAGFSAGAVFTKFIRETIDAEQEQRQLAAVLRSTGEAAGWSQDRLNEMAATLASSSIFSEGEINQAQTRLLSYTGIVGETMPRAMQAVIDMASRMGMDVTSSAETIGRALDVPSQGLAALSKQGFRFTDDQKKLVEQLEATGKTAQAQGIILAALESSYGGAAAAARDTFGGAVKALQNNINDLLTGDEGSMRQLKSSVETLNATLTSDQTRNAFKTLVGWMAEVSSKAIQAGADLVNFLSSGAKGRILGDYAMSEFGIGGREKGDRLAGSNVKAANNEISNATRFLAEAKTDEQRARAQKLLDESIAAREYWKAQQREQALGLSDDYVDGRIAAATPRPAALRGSGSQSGGGGGKEKKAKDLEAAAKRYLESLDKQLEKANELSQVEMAVAEIRRIGLEGGKVTEAMRQQILLKAADIDITKEREEAEKQAVKTREEAQRRLMELQDEGRTLTEQMRTPLEAYNAEMGRLIDLQREGAISAETFARATQTAATALGEAEKRAAEAASSQDEFAKRAVENIQGSIGSGLADVMDGNFKSIGSSFKKMLDRMVAEALAADIARRMFGSLAGGDGEGFFGGILKSFSSTLNGSGGKSGGDPLGSFIKANGIGADSGGGGSGWLSSLGGWASSLMSFDVGTDFVPEDMIAKIHKGERIVPAAQNKPGFGGITQNVTFALPGRVDRSTETQLAQKTRRVTAAAAVRF